MPYDATHIVFAHAAAGRVKRRLLLPELLIGAVGADSVGVERLLPMARSHLVIARAARIYRRLPLEGDPGPKAFAFGYLSHVWLDRFISRWLPAHPIQDNGARMRLRGFYALVESRDAEEALRIWRSLVPRPASLDLRSYGFLNPQRLGAYCDALEGRLLEPPPLEEEYTALATFAAERLRAEALAGFSDLLGGSSGS
jgi:hypothetical protein